MLKIIQVLRYILRVLTVYHIASGTLAEGLYIHQWDASVNLHCHKSWNVDLVSISVVIR